jgi:hypothetical protein
MSKKNENRIEWIRKWSIEIINYIIYKLNKNI